MGRGTELNSFQKNTYKWPRGDMKRCSTSIIIREMQIRNLRKLWNTIKHINMHIVGIPKRRETETENI